MSFCNAWTSDFITVTWNKSFEMWLYFYLLINLFRCPFFIGSLYLSLSLDFLYSEIDQSIWFYIVFIYFFHINIFMIFFFLHCSRSVIILVSVFDYQNNLAETVIFFWVQYSSAMAIPSLSNLSMLLAYNSLWISFDRPLWQLFYRRFSCVD